MGADNPNRVFIRYGNSLSIEIFDRDYVVYYELRGGFIHVRFISRFIACFVLCLFYWSKKPVKRSSV